MRSRKRLPAIVFVVFILNSGLLKLILKNFVRRITDYVHCYNADLFANHPEIKQLDEFERKK